MSANPSKVQRPTSNVRCARRRLWTLGFGLWIFLCRAFAHDPLEISATVYLHTNRIELRAVMLRKTIMLAADHQGVPLLDFSIPGEREEALPMLRSLAPGLFTLRCGTNVLRASETKVTLGAEDHVGFDLSFKIEDSSFKQPGLDDRLKLETSHLKLSAPVLAHLPTQDPYGVNVIVLDLVNNQVIGQQLLNAQNATMEIAPAKNISTNSPTAAKQNLVPALP